MYRYVIGILLMLLLATALVDLRSTKITSSSAFIASLEINESRFLYTCMLNGEGMPPHTTDYPYGVVVYFRHKSKIIPDRAYVCPQCVHDYGWPLSQLHQDTVLRHWIARRTHEDMSTLGVLTHNYQGARLLSSSVE